MHRLPLARHLPVGKLRYQYTSCRHPVEKPRWHALWLLARADMPHTPAEMADVVGLSAVTVRHVLHRWNDYGPAGVTDRRKDNGSDPKLTARRRDPLYRALPTRPPDGGGVDRAEGRPVRGGPVGRVRRPGHRVAVAAGVGVHPPGPPPEPPQLGRPADPPEVEKNLRRRVRRLKAAHPGKAVGVWAEDEARLGPKPANRRVWWLKGWRPRSRGRTRYERLYVSGFARPKPGRRSRSSSPG